MKPEIIKGVGEITLAAQAAAVLEASTEKPGNVTPSQDFQDTTYEDYLMGAISLGRCVNEAAFRGYGAGSGAIGLDEISIGALVLEGVCDIKRSHSGGNTHLGMLMLMVPISSAAGISLATDDQGYRDVRGNIRRVVSSSTIDDSRNLYTAIKTAGVGGLGELVEKEMPFSDLMEDSRERDRICRELSGDMGVIFDTALPAFGKFCLERNSLREAVLWTYLTVLSGFPDTFIEKKHGPGKAADVSAEAGKVLSGKLAVDEFDRLLRRDKVNPGTTADIVAATAMIWLLTRTRR